ncbi:hypothetical protein [uncultured Campylobacter sp.]|uniref:hypothetical protein n=1 Tax=uncultured Campylobacter sp. TaxID=218934 RepID=UPI0026127535|nr:hypothetical protein [uncultured Campylobacter sp.]
MQRVSHCFASSDKFTARKFRFLQAIDKFCPSQATLNFKISPPQNGRSYQARLY